MYNWTEQTGWARHSIFGLRSEWLDEVITYSGELYKHTLLGNRQVDSLRIWLKTCGIKKPSGCLTTLGKKFIKRGSNDLSLWELLWVNVVFNFPTAHWYVTLPEKRWTTTELRKLLQRTIPRLADRTISNAIMELAGLLERTPVGKDLGQGHVNKSRPRGIVRLGCKPGDATILFAISRLFAEQKTQRLDWNSEITWPWIIFRCNRKYVWERLTCINQDCFCLNEHGIMFNPENEEGWKCGDIMIT